MTKRILTLFIVSTLSTSFYAMDKTTNLILTLPIADPQVTLIPIVENNEELIDLSTIEDPRIIPLTSFAKLADAGHTDNGKVRKGLYNALLLMLKELPQNVGITYFEGYRPLWKQKEYFDKKFKELMQKYNDPEKAYEETAKQVSPFINNIPVHCTGAAIDLTLFKQDTEKIKLIDMGKFGVIFGPNDQKETLATNISPEQKNNRTLLLTAATKANLVNYGYEWWHYSFGDRAWAYVTGSNNALYGLKDVAKIDLPKTKEEYINSVLKQ